MGLFGESHFEKTELEIIRLQAETIERLTRQTHKPHRFRLILTKNINNSIYQLMNATLAANQQQAFTFALQDTNNPAVTPSGTFTNGTVASDNAAVATGNVDASGNVNFFAVAAGTANLTASALAAFTDSLGNVQSQQLSTDPIAVTVTSVVTADGVKLILVPGAITLQPTPPPAS